MTQINTILVDDEQEALDTLEILLSEYPKINVIEKLSNSLDVFPAIINSKIDLIFLDIKMPLINGIELLEKIRSCNPLVHIVIVTAYDNYAMKVIKHNAFSYILKPVNRLELKETIEKITKCLNAKIGNGECDKVPILSKGDTVLIAFKDVIYFVAEGNYTHVFLKTGDKMVASYNMGVFVNKFPENVFVKINRSVMVNKDCIVAINKKNKSCLIKLDNQEITLNASAKFLREFNTIFGNG